MPIAGSSTAWAQNADGDVTLSVGLVLASTALSPLLTPLGLHAVGYMASGDYAEDLHELATGGSSGFLVFSVLLPTALGVVVRALAGSRRVEAWMPALKLSTLLALLLLNYANAAVALPQILQHPDVDFLALIFVIVTLLCFLAFGAGALLGGASRASWPDRISLIFGLGMNNNGTGLVLAATALADHPRVLLPVIAYNLVQQLVAAIVDRKTRRGARSSVEPGSGPSTVHRLTRQARSRAKG